MTVDAATEVINITIYIGFKRADGSWSCDHLLGRCALSDHTLARNEMQSMTAGSNLVWVVMSALSSNVGEQLTCGDRKSCCIGSCPIIGNWRHGFVTE